MKFLSTRRTQILRLFAAVAVGVPLAMAATPSSAAGANCGYSSGAQSQQCHGQAQSTPKVGTGEDVRAVCSAETPFPVQATIVSCEIKGTNSDNHWSGASVVNGPAAALTHTWQASELSSNSYTLCVYAGYISTTGVYHAPTNPTCGVTIGTTSVVI
jgi:hypothetical protein